MAEGMQGISRAQAAFHAQQHQELIARIRSRMESLCQHCRAASDGRSYILENGDGEIGNDCNVHNFFRSMRRGCLFRVGDRSQLQVLRLTAPALIEARRISASSLACSKTRAGFRIPLTWFVPLSSIAIPANSSPYGAFGTSCLI